MPAAVQKGAAITILTFLSSSVLMSAVAFFLKDTVDKVNDTVERVNKTQVSMQKFKDTVSHLGDKLDTLNTSVNRSAIILDNYTRVHGKNLATMSVSMSRVTEKLVDLTDRCDESDMDLEKCKQHVLLYTHDQDKDNK